MTGSTNNIDVGALTKKFADVLELFKDKEEIHQNNLAITFEVCINYIKQIHADLDIEIKVLTMFVIKELYFKNKITTDGDMINIITAFVHHYKEHYTDYISKYKGSDKQNINVLFGKEFVKDRLAS